MKWIKISWVYRMFRLDLQDRYCMSKKAWPILYSILVYEMDQDFLDIQYVSYKRNLNTITAYLIFYFKVWQLFIYDLTDPTAEHPQEYPVWAFCLYILLHSIIAKIGAWFVVNM